MMTPRIAAAVEAALSAGYFVRPRYDGRCNAINAWWMVCKDKQLPYVVLTRSEGRDFVEMDLLDYHLRPTLEQLEAGLDQLEQAIQAEKPLGKRRKSWIVGTYGVTTVYLEVPRGFGERLALVLREIAAKGAPRAR
jgi:hypothetical protein